MNGRAGTILVAFLIFSILTIFHGCAGEEDGSRSENEALLMSVLWVQTAAEYRALAYQAFNVARMRVDEDLKRARTRKRAVVVDLDETVLNNSPYEAKSITDNQSYPLGWKEWCDMAEAIAVPGAKEFLDYAVSEGCDVFYLSNRKLNVLEGSMRNLARLEFPLVERSHFLFRDKDYSKEGRRLTIAETHDIILLIGDNLNDFDDVFAGRPIRDRLAAADTHRENFGREFILLPNPMYGEWENALYDYDMELSPVGKQRMRMKHLEGY